MQLGMIGLGKMGASMVRRLQRGGHQCIIYDRNTAAVNELAAVGAVRAASRDELLAELSTPRVLWLMVPAVIADGMIEGLMVTMSPGDTIIDAGNSHFIDDIRRARLLQARGIHYVDVGTSGGASGLERGYCQMIGGEDEVVRRLDPIFRSLAPGRGEIPRTPGRQLHGGTAEEGYLHCGQHGAGHFVKMVHNGIEHGLMAAYAEGLNLLRHANAGKRRRLLDAETAPLRDPEHYQYDFDLADIAEVWRRGSVITSRLLDLTASALLEQPNLQQFSGRVPDAGEGRWTIAAAIDEGVPVPVLSAAVYERFASRSDEDFANKVLAAMRLGFGGHLERSG